MPPASVTMSRTGRVVDITLPGTALSFADAVEVERCALAVADLDGVNVVVLTSAGPDFCPGPGPDLDGRRHEVDPVGALGRLDVPIIAALAGSVRSVGLELALVSDIRIAAADSRCSFPEVAAGRLPEWGGTQRLPRAVGRQAATAMLILGDVLDADAAAAHGLVHEVVADGSAAKDRAAAIAAEIGDLAPVAVRYAKEAVLRGAEMDLIDGLKLEGDLNTLLQVSTDRAEGLGAFFEKRPPRFTGR